MLDPKIKALYIVSEKDCLSQNSGANKHIQIGIKELNTYFDISLFCLFTPTNIVEKSKSELIIKKKISQSSFWKGTLKDLLTLYKNHRYIFKYYKEIKELKPRFIYERSAYLNFTGLLIAKKLKIPHFYEVNGIHSKDVQVYYKSILNGIIHKCILSSYKTTDAVFFVGNYKKYLNFKSENSYSVENGIEQTIIDKFQFLQKVQKKHIRVVFVGHAMPHHGLNMFCDAINMMKHSENFDFTFIGRNTDEIGKLLKPHIKVSFLGSKSEPELYDLIQQYDIGIIPASSEYASSMKLFLYGAAKLCVIVPSTQYFLTGFNEKEVLFFENNNKHSLASTFDNLVENKIDYTAYGEQLFSLIKDKYTWEKIFKFKRDIINTIMSTRVK